MEKVWFKLRQTHYPPPTVESMGTNEETGPICLGHFIQDLKHIDFVLNRDELEEFPANMHVYPTTAFEFKWDSNKDRGSGTRLEGGAPILAAAGMTIKGNLQLMFKDSMSDHEEYERLDTYIVQITKPYVRNCLEVIPSLIKYSHAPWWSMFVITGIMVARGTKQRIASGSKEKYIDVGPEIDFPGIATAAATLNLERGETQNIRQGGASDFVFAVRLAKVSQNLLQTDWSLDKTYTKKATFNAGTEKVDIGAVVEREGIANYHVLEGDNLDFALVVISDDLETKAKLERGPGQKLESGQDGKPKDEENSEDAGK